MNLFETKLTFVMPIYVYYHNTMNKKDFCLPFRKLNITKNAPNWIGLIMCKKLSQELKKSELIALFKRKLKAFLMGKPIYDIKLVWFNSYIFILAYSL